jgi:predicted nucleic acid-binding protein
MRFRDMSRWVSRGSSFWRSSDSPVIQPCLSIHSLSAKQKHACASGLDCDHVRLLAPQERTFERFFSLLDEAGLGGNLATDALIAAHAEDYSGTIHSTDRDFDRFSAVRWINPLKR